MLNPADKSLLARLVGIDSTSERSVEPIVDVVCDYLERPGVVVDRHPGGGPGKVNVIARRGPASDDGGGLNLCGHLDVVPATEPEWTGDPFVMRERDDTLVGRGTCDMKGFVAVAMNLFLEADEQRLDAPLCLLLTCDEELGSLGARALLESPDVLRALPRATVIGEPTSLRAVRMHKGHLKMRVRVDGRPAHSGSPHLGVNAIEPAARVVTALAALRAAMAGERVESSAVFPTVPFAVLNVATIHGGSAINVVPEACVIEIGVRLLPGQDSGAARRRVVEAVHESAGESAVTVEPINDNPPMELDADASLCRTLRDVLGQKETVGVSFASDAGVLQQAGLECVLFGPGTIEVAHRPDEHVPIDELVRCRELLGTIIERHCRS